MRNIIFAFLVGFFLAGMGALAFSQEKGAISAGFGVEANNYSVDGAALGFRLSAAYGITEDWAAGLVFGINRDFKRITVLEGQVFARRYLFPLGGGRFFAQLNAGGAAVFDYYDAHPSFSGGASAGYRFPVKILAHDFYLEPFVGAGFPYLWRAGITAAYLFNIKSAPGSREAGNDERAPAEFSARPDALGIVGARSVPVGNEAIAEPRKARPLRTTQRVFLPGFCLIWAYRAQPR
jgi:hypothetical protein